MSQHQFPNKGVLNGLHLCITGTMTVDRDEMIEIITKLGGTNHTSAAKAVDVLLANQSEFVTNSPKTARAKKLGIPIVRESWFWDTVNSGVLQDVEPHAWWVRFVFVDCYFCVDGVVLGCAYLCR
jgi:NAD-dependent DNA ligase